MNNEKKKFVSSFLLGLIAGGLLAGAGSHFYYCHRHDKAPWGEKREMRHRKLLKEFTEKLQLNEEQRKKVEQILESKRQKMQELRKETYPKFKELRESVRSEIREILTPEQKIKFEQMSQEHEKRWEEKFQRN